MWLSLLPSSKESSFVSAETMLSLWSPEPSVVDSDECLLRGKNEMLHLIGAETSLAAPRFSWDRNLPRLWDQDWFS